jgi:hypothetical protein
MTLLVLSILSSSVQAQDFTILPIARFEDPAPNGELFDSTHALSVNDSGQVAFAALTGAQGGLFLYEQGKILAIVRQGQPAPGGGEFLAFGYLWLNQRGHIVFSVSLSTGDDGVFLFDGNSIRAIARSGEAAPGCGPFGSLVLPWLNNEDQVVFIGRASGRYGTFFYDGNQVLTVACPGDPAPGGGTFVSTLMPTLNDWGQVVFEGQVSSPGRAGIFLYEKGELRQIVRGGDPAPGGETFSGLYVPLINASGQVAFVGFLRTTPETYAAFLFDEGKIRTLVPSYDAETGEEVEVGPPSGARPFPLYFNDLGQTAFVGGKRFPGEQMFRSGLFYFDGKIFKTILFEGDPMPDPRGYTFSTVLFADLNNAGQIAFVAGGYHLLRANGLFFAVPNQ